MAWIWTADTRGKGVPGSPRAVAPGRRFSPRRLTLQRSKAMQPPSLPAVRTLLRGAPVLLPPAGLETTFAMADVRDELMVARTTNGGVVRRPLSPHLQVYRPQITSVLSIMHRFTGIALSAGALLLVAWLVAAAKSPAAYAAVAGFVGSWIGLVLLFGWTAALFFHLLNGIRHLAWDAGYGFDLPVVHRSGWAVVVGTAVLTVLVWVVGLAV